MALTSSSIPSPSFSSSKRSYYNINTKESRSLSTSLLPRPSTSTCIRPSALMHAQRRRPSHIPLLKPSTSKSLSTTTSSSSQTSQSTSSSSLLNLPPSSTGTRSSPLKMAGQHTNARVLVQCLGTQLVVEDSGAVVTLPQQQHTGNAKRKRFIYDHVIGPNESTRNMMPSLQPLIHQALYGYHGTILCYGPAGCGKSSVMLGSQNSAGIILQSTETLFDRIFKESGSEYVIRASYYEVYQDVLRDLICPSNLDINIHETKKKSAYVGPLTEEIITSPTDVSKIMQKGQANLYLCSDKHDYKDSHVVFQLVIESQKRTNPSKISGSFGSSSITTSHMMFIDLADSEIPPSSSASTFTMNQHYPLSRRQKRKDIGLTAFEATVLQLSGKDKKYTPSEWKNSSLTRLLDSSLNGQTNLASICVIDDRQHSYEYLKFACRLRKLAVSPKVNEETNDQSVLSRHRRDRLKLKNKLAQLNSEPHQSDDYHQMIRTALTRQLTYNREQIITREKETTRVASPTDLSPSISTSSSSSLSSLLAAANNAKAISDKMEQNEGSLIKELYNEKHRLLELNRTLYQQLTFVENKVYTLEQQKKALDNMAFLQDELDVAKTELEVTKLLVYRP